MYLLQILRLIHIQIVLLRHGLDELVFTIPLFRPLSFLRFINPFYWLHDKEATRGERIRCALEELGPIFVKIGQVISTRRDLIPDDIAEELVKLQDKVPPFGSKQAIAIVEAALGAKIADKFAFFDPIPLASASVAQVHAAKLLDGREVVVKVLRPNIEKTIFKDTGILKILARIAQRYSKDARRLKPLGVVLELEQSLMDELDLLREAANASQLRRNFPHSELLYVPEVYWPLTRKNVMVIERIYGVPVADLELLKSLDVDLKKLAERIIALFFEQVFRDCFFHADMHAGNIFVDCSDPKSPSYITVDFGIVGILSPHDQRYLAENLLAFLDRDYRRVAELHLESGWIPAKTRADVFEGAIRTVCEPMFERPQREVSFGHLLLRLFQTARRFEMEIQPQLLLLQKTLVNIEGLGRQLDPDLDLWNTARPHIQKWMKQRLGIRHLFKEIRQRAPYWSTKMPEIPDLIYRILENASILPVEKPAEKKPTRVVLHNNKNKILMLISGGLICFGAIYYFQNSLPQVSRLSAELAVILGALGLYLGLKRD